MRLSSFFTDATAVHNPGQNGAAVPAPLWRRPGAYLAVLIFLAALVGLWLAPQYGQSEDEPARINYAALSLKAYEGKLDSTQILKDEKGAFYVMLAYLSANALQTLIPGWKFIDGWHYMNFLAFLMGVFFFYRLCRRLIRPGPALAATLLFASQPLIWGHAFMNPKDTPFMAFFLGSVTLGLEMVDQQMRRQAASPAAESLRRRLAALPGRWTAIWKNTSRRKQRLLIGLVAALVFIGVSFVPIRLGLAWLVDQAYHAAPASLLGQVFQRLAQFSGQIPVETYVAKAQALYAWLAIRAAAVLVLALVGLAYTIIPAALIRLVRFMTQPRLILAGLFLGFVSDIRTLGPASGLLVVTYFLVKSGRKAAPALLEYLGIGALTSYALWPYLWGNPVQNYLASFSEAADFFWRGDNLFGGVVYPMPTIPAGYFPTLFAAQFTETAMVLFLIGLLLAAIYLWKRKGLRLDLLLLGAWFTAPIAAALLLNSTVYNNFRQFLFILPPLFVVAGFAWQAIWDRLKHRAVLFGLLVSLALAPALYWDVHLNPYQYIYYNSLVGGVSGAYNVYEGDYWLTSNKEAVEYVNQVAPPGSTVYFWKIALTAYPFARPDLKVLSEVDFDPSQVKEAGYAVILWLRPGDETIFPNSQVLYQIKRDGNVLGVVKKYEPGDLVSTK